MAIPRREDSWDADCESGRDRMASVWDTEAILLREPETQELDLLNPEHALLRVQCDPMSFKMLKNLLQVSIMQCGGGRMHHHVIQVDGDTPDTSPYE